MTRVLGVDPSLTSTGLARITVESPTADREAVVDVVTTCLTSTGHKTDLPRQRRQRVQGLRRGILRAAMGCDLVVMETPFYNRQSTQGAIMDRSWLWGTVVDGLDALGIPCVHMANKQRTKFATDNGNDGKEKVAVAMDRLWHAHLADKLRNDDEYDALSLATAGVIKLHGRRRLPIRVLEHHLQVIAGLDWTEIDT